jgi:hypothetical protein
MVNDRCLDSSVKSKIAHDQVRRVGLSFLGRIDYSRMRIPRKMAAPARSNSPVGKRLFSDV